MPAKPALRTELLFYLSFLAAAALLVGVATMLVVNVVAPQRTFVLLLVLVALEVGVFVVFGGSLVHRLVLRPLDRVVATADAVADGDLARRAPDAETSDFSTLAERLNRMTDHLLDAQGQVVRSEKLASIGRLAAGIAHEVGNPLGALGTYVEVLRRRGADAEVVAGVTRELERIDRIVRGLLDYARPHDEALPGPATGALPPRGRRPSRGRGILARPARRPRVRRRLRAGRAARRPRQDLRPVLHHQTAGSGHGTGPGDRGACRGRHGRRRVGGHGARRRRRVQDVLPPRRPEGVRDEPGAGGRRRARAAPVARPAAQRVGLRGGRRGERRARWSGPGPSHST